MNQTQNEQLQGALLADCARTFREWHDRAKAIDTPTGCSPSTPKMPFWRTRSSQPYSTTNRTVSCAARANCAGFSSRVGGDAQMISCAGIAQANG